eukprot:scaffold54475_cov69-Phaeocystis_antarctica.AAC.8
MQLRPLDPHVGVPVAVPQAARLVLLERPLVARLPLGLPRLSELRHALARGVGQHGAGEVEARHGVAQRRRGPPVALLGDPPLVLADPGPRAMLQELLVDHLDDDGAAPQVKRVDGVAPPHAGVHIGPLHHGGLLGHREARGHEPALQPQLVPRHSDGAAAASLDELLLVDDEAVAGQGAFEAMGLTRRKQHPQRRRWRRRRWRTAALPRTGARRRQHKRHVALVGRTEAHRPVQRGRRCPGVLHLQMIEATEVDGGIAARVAVRQQRRVGPLRGTRPRRDRLEQLRQYWVPQARDSQRGGERASVSILCERQQRVRDHVAESILPLRPHHRELVPAPAERHAGHRAHRLEQPRLARAFPRVERQVRDVLLEVTQPVGQERLPDLRQHAALQQLVQGGGIEPGHVQAQLLRRPRPVDALLPLQPPL